MSFYECTVIARQDVSTADVDKIVDDLKDVLKEQGGEVLKREYWGLRGLAYRVKKNRKGHYVYLGINAPSAAMDELNRRIHLNEDIIRTLTVKVDGISEEPTAMIRSANSGSEETGRHTPSGRAPRPRRTAESE